MRYDKISEGYLQRVMEVSVGDEHWPTLVVYVSPWYTTLTLTYIGEYTNYIMKIIFLGENNPIIRHVWAC